MIIFISPIAIAGLIIIINKYQLFKKICTYFNINALDTDPSAWDFKFKNIKSEWVIVTLNDNKNVKGFLGENSFISQYSKGRDLYIDKVYEMKPNGIWNKRKGTDGIWIKGEEIKSIEFLKSEEGDKDNEKNTKK